MELLEDNLAHVLFAVLLISRIGDILSTYLATPNLTLEANLIARKFKWKFGLLTILVAFVPYYNTAIGVAVLVPSLLVCSSNFGRAWVMRTMGEREYKDMLLRVARRSSYGTSVVYVIVSSLFMAAAGMLLMMFYPDPSTDWGYWFAFGIVGYSLVILIHGSIFLKKLFREAAAIPAEAERPATV